MATPSHTMDSNEDYPRPDSDGGDPATPREQSAVETAADDSLESCRRECESLRNENLRIIAESRNQQQRAIRDKQEALKFAEFDFARDLLVIIDDMDRTREAAAAKPDVKTLTDGVRIVFDHLLKILKERQIEPITAAPGTPFDPTWHEALMKQPSNEIPDGHVIKEVGKGFKMRDRALRPARVIISSGGANSG